VKASRDLYTLAMSQVSQKEKTSKVGLSSFSAHKHKDFPRKISTFKKKCLLQYSQKSKTNHFLSAVSIH
jgi:hypothetical protein